MVFTEALQYVKLNPGEEVKYGEYWAQAVGDNENVGGKEAVAFLGRAKKVSKGQLRRIWDIADHRNEGFLGRDEFYVALRLVALAQRGAELSVAGLRNFTGIQLVPDIAPEEKKEQPKQEVSTKPKPDMFSWTVPKEVAEKYDGLFKKLDARNVGMIDGKQAVTFFGKSGLPRPTLKKIWDLADVTRDGMLSLDEFRNAMHMVSNILNRKLTVTALPSALDPSGPNWLRIESEEDTAPLGNEQSQHGDDIHDPVVLQMPTNAPVVIAPPPPPPPPQQPESAPISPLQAPLQMQGTPTLSAKEQAVPVEQSTVQDNEAERMREALLKERMEVERARREMEEMKAEMEKLRLERESLAAAKAQSAAKAPSTVPVLPRSAIPAPAPPAKLPYMQNKSPALLPQRSTIPAAASSPQVSSTASASPPLASTAAPIALGATATPVNVPKSTPTGAVRTEPISLGNDDDDIWDQPSPKASAMPGPSPGIVKGNKTSELKDSVSSDDEDDFWGGLGAKPTLGPAGGQKPSEAKQQGFGGSELDDWVF